MVKPTNEKVSLSNNLTEKSTPSKFLAPGQLSTMGKSRGRGRIELGKFSASSRAVENGGVIGKSIQKPSSLCQRVGTNSKFNNNNSKMAKGGTFPASFIKNTHVQGESSVVQNERVTTRSKDVSMQSTNLSSTSEIVLAASQSLPNLSEQTPTDNSTKKDWKPRGRNKCLKVARLSAGSKLPITFYNKLPAGDNMNEWSRHLGRLVRDSNIIRIRLHSWNDLEQRHKDHVWAAMKAKFSNEVIEDYKVPTLEHARDLWNNWRGEMHRSIKNLPIVQQLKRKPKVIEEQADWEWLVKEHYHSSDFVVIFN